ncbi:MAG: rhomboid family intramembrane serine protease [Nanoarchaeota archaeon]
MKIYTLWLSLICIALFILQLVIPGFTDALVLNQQSFSQPWRFLTSIFLHGSLAHLLYNLFALVLFGLILERLIGSNRFLIVFFASGIIANLIAVNFYSSSLGASGAIFGVIGALTVIKPLMRVWAFSLPMPLFLASVLWTIGNILQTIFPSNIGTIAHLSGIIVGLIFGLVFRARYRKMEQKKVSLFSGTIKIPESYMQDWENRYLKNH